jgi:adenylate kinase family enzyme
VVDLFDDFACGDSRELNKDGLRSLLNSIGEWPDEATLTELFQVADTDRSGLIDLDEFLSASDKLLASNPARCILVVGGPGSGKGHLCSQLVRHCNVSHISSGDMLREEVAAGTPLGQQVAAIMERGELVSSELIVTLLRRRMRQFGGRRLLLDGFPRSQQNAIDFGDQCGRPELALNLVCSEEVMLQRILKRAQARPLLRTRDPCACARSDGPWFDASTRSSRGARTTTARPHCAASPSTASPPSRPSNGCARAPCPSSSSTATARPSTSGGSSSPSAG